MASATLSCINRIAKEIASIEKGSDLSLAVACRDDDVRKVRALIVGPPDTPYEFGFFEFTMQFPKDYPIKSPSVICITTNGGQTRFNPNIYAQGKVCLSILGTWPGEKGEEWSSAQGLESVLLSIQSLMSSNPWENEPGEEDGKIDEPEPAAYASKVRHETLRIAVINRLENVLKINTTKYSTIDAKEKKKKVVDLAGNSASGASPDVSPTAASSENKSPLTTSQAQSPPAGSDGHDGQPQEGSEAFYKLKTLHGNANAWKAQASALNNLDYSDLDPPFTDSSIHEYDAEATYNSLNPHPWDPFTDVMKRRFLWYYDSYIAAIEQAQSKQKDGSKFVLTRFEMGGNAMAGSYNYAELRSRLDRIRDALADECAAWTAQGANEVRDKTQLATQLAFQFNQLKHHYNETSYSGSRLELSLPDKNNPFAWRLTFFGQSSTNLDSGVFNLSLTIPPDFPASWPRVYIETPIFHHRVSPSTGALCYFPAKPDEISSHLRAIVAAIEDLEPKYDPRAVVNPDAAKLLWGNEADKKMYFRKLRRSAQESSEF